MSNPVYVSLTAGVWKKVASGVTYGQVWKADIRPNVYVHTYRMEGATAPDESDNGVEIFTNVLHEDILSSNSIDVYVKTVGKDGKVRVDLP